MKISNAIEGYFLDKELDFSPKTVSGYRLFFRHLVEFLEDAQIQNVSTPDIRRFLNYLARDKKQDGKGWAKRSVHDAWIALSSLWTWAEKELEIKHVIRGKIAAPKFTKKVIQPFSAEEIKQLIRAAEYTSTWQTKAGKSMQNKRPTALRDIAIIYTLLDAGIRNTELRQLCVSDYEQKSGRLFIARGKGDKQRFVVLGNRSRKALWRYLASRDNPKPTEPLFAAKSGEQLDANNLRHTLNMIAKNANVANVYPHRFRHTFAINFLRNGGNLFVLQELLGHESLEMVRYYARLAEIDIDGAAAFSVADRWKI